MNKYIIPIIKKRKEAEARKQLQIPLYRDPPPEYKDNKDEEKPKRGSVIVDFNIDKDSSNE